MSSILPLASGIVAASERSLLLLGRTEDKNSSGAAFAIRPAVESQDADPYSARFADPVVLPVDLLQNIALAHAAAPPSDAAALYSAVASSVDQSGQIAAANVNAAAAETMLPPLTGDSMLASSQAAYAYAQIMQAWLETRIPRPIAPRTLPKTKTRERPRR